MLLLLLITTPHYFIAEMVSHFRLDVLATPLLFHITKNADTARACRFR